MNINELEGLSDDWLNQAFDIVDGQPVKGNKFIIWKIRTKREKNAFKKLFDSKMKWIRNRLTPESEESKQDFSQMVKKLSLAVP